MPANKDSPRYPGYLAECKALFDEASKQEQEYLDEHPNWLGQDHPKGDKIRAVIDERNEKYRQIQKVRIRLSHLP